MVSRLPLSERLYQHFREVGFLRAPDVLPPQLVRRMAEVVSTELKEERHPYRVGSDGRPIRLDKVARRDDAFLAGLAHEAVLGPLGSLLGPNIVLLTNRHNHATLNRRGDIPYRLHRDILQWSRPIVTAIIYLEEATVDNGCTHVVPGSHTAQFAGMPPDGGGGNWADDHDEYAHFLDQAVPVPMPAGGILLLDSLAFHSVGRNVTDGTRMSATFALRSADELTKEGEDTYFLTGKPVYKGNELDHGKVIPALNSEQAM